MTHDRSCVDEDAFREKPTAQFGCVGKFEAPISKHQEMGTYFGRSYAEKNADEWNIYVGLLTLESNLI